MNSHKICPWRQTGKSFLLDAKNKTFLCSETQNKEHLLRIYFSDKKSMRHKRLSIKVKMKSWPKCEVTCLPWQNTKEGLDIRYRVMTLNQLFLNPYTEATYPNHSKRPFPSYSILVSNSSWSLHAHVFSWMTSCL